MIDAVAMLKDTKSAIVIVNGDRVIKSNERGIKFVLGLVESGDNILHGATVADKVVGRAVAFLFAKGGVRRVYAEVMSSPAKEVLEEYGIECECESLVDGIENRTHDGQCPMESAVLDVHDCDSAIKVLKAKLQSMHTSKE